MGVACCVAARVAIASVGMKTLADSGARRRRPFPDRSALTLVAIAAVLAAGVTVGWRHFIVHDGNATARTMAADLPLVIDGLRERGYEFVLLP